MSTWPQYVNISTHTHTHIFGYQNNCPTTECVGNVAHDVESSTCVFFKEKVHSVGHTHTRECLEDMEKSLIKTKMGVYLPKTHTHTKS